MSDNNGTLCVTDDYMLLFYYILGQSIDIGDRGIIGVG